MGALSYSLSAAALCILLAAACDFREVGFDGGPLDAGVDSGPGVDAGVDAGGPIAIFDLVFDGCAPDFSSAEPRVGYYLDRDGVGYLILGGPTSLALNIGAPPGTAPVSTQAYVDGDVRFNFPWESMSWASIAAQFEDVLAGRLPDPVGGTLTINRYDGQRGLVDIEFTGVTVQARDERTCQMNGRVQAFGRTN